MKSLRASGAWVLIAAGTAGSWAACDAGAWWLTFLIGVVIGMVLRGRTALPAAAAAGALGWGLPLAWLQETVGLGAAASALGGIIGYPGLGGVVPTLFTLVTGALLAATGAWLGLAVRRLFPPRRPVRPEDAHQP